MNINLTKLHCFFIIIALALTACPTDEGGGGGETTETENTFILPALTLIPGTEKITYTFTPSQNPAADSYELYWKKGSGLTADDVKTGNRVGNPTSGNSIDGLSNGTAYSFIVTAIKEGESIGVSVVQTATTNAFTAPDLTLDPGDKEITYKFTASNPEADSYDLYWTEGSNLSADEVKDGTKIPNATSGYSITGLTNGTAYRVIVTAIKGGDPIGASVVQTTTPGISYIITGSGTNFTATKGSETIGTAGQPIQTVIDAVRSNANGAACIIQFGNETTALNTGTAGVSFSNTGGTWGAVTLTGKITSAVPAATSGLYTLPIISP